jgi:hypothetical protein
MSIDVAIISVTCEGAYKPDHIGECIEFNCLIQEINTGFNVICSYSPGHNEWWAGFVNKSSNPNEVIDLNPIDEPDLDWKSFGVSGILTPNTAANQDLRQWWAAYPIAASRHRLGEILNSHYKKPEFPSLAQSWIKSHGVDLWDEIPPEPTSVSQKESPLRGKLYQVKAEGREISLCEAHSPQDAINRTFKVNRRSRSKYRNWEAIEIPLGDKTLYYKNLDGAMVIIDA